MEYIDIVNDNDEVVGRVTRDEIYANAHTHRAVQVLIRNGRGQIAMQLRSPEIGYCPEHWSFSAAGHVSSGEDYAASAARELAEELGISADLKLVVKDLFDERDRGIKKQTGLFEGEHEGPFTPNPEEVARVQFFDLAEIRDMVARGEKFLPDTLYLLKKYYLDK